jgi:rRNA processing protein Krr1/Pno1
VNHPLALKWKLFELDLGRDTKNLEEFWETALSNLRKARARVVGRYNAERKQAEFVWAIYCF